jgi:hypothetical protein
MSKTNVLATLHGFSFIPPGSVFRGKDTQGRLKIDYYINSETPPSGAVQREKLKDVKEDGTTTFIKPGENIKTSAELVKEGKPISKPPKEKTKKSMMDGKQ